MDPLCVCVDLDFVLKTALAALVDELNRNLRWLLFLERDGATPLYESCSCLVQHSVPDLVSPIVTCLCAMFSDRHVCMLT
jgi:hypothetical protein